MSHTLRQQLVKLGSTNPGLRPHIRQVLASLPKEAAAPSRPSGKLDRATRERANEALAHMGFDGNTPYERLGKAISDAFVVLRKFGIESDSATPLLNRESGKERFDIAFIDPSDPFSPSPISNSVLYFTWYRHETGNYEILAYLT